MASSLLVNGRIAEPKCSSYQRWTRAWLRTSTSTPQVVEQRGGAANHSVLGLVGQVRIVEVEEVVITDARVRGVAGDLVPHRLEESAGGEVPLRYLETSSAIENLRHDGVGVHGREKEAFVHREIVGGRARSGGQWRGGGVGNFVNSADELGESVPRGVSGSPPQLVVCSRGIHDR